MKQDKEWMDAMRSALRDAEVPPPEGGWQRLERELGAAAPGAAVRRIHWPRIVAAAAAVLICVAVGEFLWQADRGLDTDGVVIATADSGGAAETRTEEPVLAQSVQTEAPVAVGAERTRSVLRLRTGINAVSDAGTGQAAPEPLSDLGALSGAEPGPDAASDAQPAGQPVTRSGQGAEKQAAKSAASPRQFRSPEPFVAYVAPRKKTSFGLFGGGAVTGGTTTPGLTTRSMLDMSALDANGMVLAQSPNYKDYSFRHHQPLSFGLSVRKEFPHGLSLESGVTYTYLSSDVRMKFSTEDVSQQLHFIGVPLRMNWQFLERGRFSLYLGAGGMVEKCISAKFGSKQFDEQGVQWSAFGAVGAQYRLGNLVGLYFEPEASYYFTETELRTARTESPLTLTLRLGVRFSF